MAAKNQVTLTFAGDSKSLEQTNAKVEAGAKGVESAFDKMGESSQRAVERVRGVGTSVDGVSDRTRKGSKDTEQYTSRLDRAGEAGGNAESQFLGLGAGISGTSALMRGGSLSAEEMAMAVADIGDSVEHTVVPWLSKGKEAVSGFVDRIGGVKGILIGGGALAAVGAMGFAIKEMNDAANRKNLDMLADRLQSAGYAATDMNKAMVFAAAVTGHLDDQFERAMSAGEQQAAQFIELAAASGVSTEKLREMRERLELSTGAQEAATEASEEHSRALETEADKIRGVNDARLAAIDPVFAVIDALRSHEEAQRAVDEAEATAAEARKEHGASSTEYAEAVRGIVDAEIAAVQSAADMESAAAELEAQIAEHPATLSNANLALERWVAQGLITEEQARQMAVRFQSAADKADEIQGTRTADLQARDNASHKITNVGNRLDELDGQSATVGIVANISAAAAWAAEQILGAAGGGIVPQYLAAGGMSLARGTDTVPAMLTPGEMVLNSVQQAELWSMANGGGGGGGRLVQKFYIQGSVLSERDLTHAVNRATRKGRGIN